MNLKFQFLKVLLKRKKEKKYFENINKILFIRPAKIGDAIVSFPLLRELKSSFPNAQIDVLAGIHSVDTFNRLPYINKIYIKYKKRDFFKTWKTIFELRKEKYDLLIDTTDIKFWFTFSTRLINSRYYLSQDGNYYKGGLKSDLSFYDKTLPLKKGEHYVYRMLNYLKLLNITNYNRSLEFFLYNDEKKEAGAFQTNLKYENFVVINIDASSIERSIKENDLIKILDSLAKYLSEVSIIIFCLPSRRKSIEKVLLKFDNKKVKLSYETKTIFQASALLSLSKLIITPDTSFVHIASCFNLPQVCFYRDNNEHIKDWGPLSEKYEVIKSSDKNNNSIQGFNHNHIIEAIEKLDIF